MCGRFTLSVTPGELREQLSLGFVPENLGPQTNIAPGQPIPVIIDAETRDLHIMRWGLVPPWAKDIAIGYKMFNARSETLLEKPSFKNAFRRRRCLIPADGFYEWQTLGKTKQPWHFHLIDRNVFTFAGLWERWQDAQGNELESCTVITTQANALVAQYHDRMPVILDDRTRWAWLEDQPLPFLQSLLQPYAAEQMDCEAVTLK